MTRVALVTTIRDERAMLRPNLLVHHELGVERAWVFLDGTTDGSEETVRDLPWVEVARSVGVEALRELPRGVPEIDRLAERYADIHTARQMLHYLVVQERARRAGFDWLVCIDVDEIVCTDPLSMAPGALAAVLGALPADVPVARFAPIEVLPTQVDCDEPFRELTLFRNAFRLEPAPRPVYCFARTLPDPILDEEWIPERYLGHLEGKCAIRTEGELYPVSCHSFVGPGSAALPTADVPWLLHYFCTSADDFIRKYRNKRDQPDRFVLGEPVPWRPERMFQALVNSGAFSPEEQRAYFADHLRIRDEEVARWRAEAADKIVEVHAVRDVLARIGR